MRPPAYTPTQNNIPVISRQKQCLYASVPVHVGPCLFMIVSRANPHLSPAIGPPWLIPVSYLLSKTLHTVAKVRLKPLKSPAINALLSLSLLTLR